jgi:hypothetical protein
MRLCQALCLTLESATHSSLQLIHSHQSGLLEFRANTVVSLGSSYSCCSILISHLLLCITVRECRAGTLLADLIG